MTVQTWDALAMLALIVGPPGLILGFRLILEAIPAWRD